MGICRELYDNKPDGLDFIVDVWTKHWKYDFNNIEKKKIDYHERFFFLDMNAPFLVLDDSNPRTSV